MPCRVLTKEERKKLLPQHCTCNANFNNYLIRVVM